jgi:hypothetical protein
VLFKNARISSVRRLFDREKTDMPVAPEHSRAARLAPLPRLPLSAIFGFSVAGFGGALFLAYSTFSPSETTDSLAAAKPAAAFEARAVPFDSRPEDAVARATAVARALTATPNDAQRSERIESGGEVEQSETSVLPGASGELKGFSRFANSGGANSYLAITGSTFGMGAHMAPSGISATNAEDIVATAVPEASTWLCGAALLALVVARGLHASWYRHQRRSESKSDSVN